MKALASSDATERLLRTLWLQRLSTRIQQLLLIFEDTTLDKLAECADKLWEHPSSQEVQAVTTAPTTGATVQAIDPVDTITKRLDELALQVASLTYKTRRRGTERQRGRSTENVPRRGRAHRTRATTAYAITTGVSATRLVDARYRAKRKRPSNREIKKARADRSLLRWHRYHE